MLYDYRPRKAQVSYYIIVTDPDAPMLIRVSLYNNILTIPKCQEYFLVYIWQATQSKGETFNNKKRRNATKPGFQRFNQVLIWQE